MDTTKVFDTLDRKIERLRHQTCNPVNTGIGVTIRFLFRDVGVNVCGP
jgi:hypothetical protein